MVNRTRPRGAQGFRQLGFSLLELVVVIIIISVLLVIALDRLRQYQVVAERVAMEQVLGSLRSAMGIELSRRVIREGLRAAMVMDGENPMRYLAQVPYNYEGEFKSPNPEKFTGSVWYFDSVSRLLIYKVSNDQAFETDLTGPKRARFRQAVIYTDRNANGVFELNQDDINGFQLAPQEPYRWLVEPADIR